MYFQSVDDKEQCLGIYVGGALHFDGIPSNLQRTWKYTGSLKDPAIEYAWLRCGGLPLGEACPEDLVPEWEAARRKMHAFKKSFEIAKIDFRDHCFFDLVPYDFLTQFLEVKNKITEHVFANFASPENYGHLDHMQKFLHKLKYQTLNVNTDNCKNLFYSSGTRASVQKLVKSTAYIDYNLFGTVTGRLATSPHSFPILTMKKELRKILKPHHDWFLSLDYNGAEIRTLLALSGEEQPKNDIHQWNVANVFKRLEIDRSEAKTIFFAWLYNPESTAIVTPYYNRQKVLDTCYDGGYISTVFGRHIKVEPRKAFNYLIQSTTADLVNERALAIDRLLEGRKSFVSHIVHDEIVIDFADEDREAVEEIKRTFANNRLGTFMVNLKVGKNYYDLEDLSL